MKLPDDVRHQLTRIFRNKQQEWLVTQSDNQQWPLIIYLHTPTEQEAMQQVDGVRAWLHEWQQWQGSGSLIWCERYWRTLGMQRLPEMLLFKSPEEVVLWIGESQRFKQAKDRFVQVVERWPTFREILPKHFKVLADYSETDFCRLLHFLDWIVANPKSNLYLRQLPIAGIDSKWLEGRKELLRSLISTMQNSAAIVDDFFQYCGLKAPPQLMRMRILDQGLRKKVGGLGDITAPWEQLANLDLSATKVFIVENLQTGLAFPDLPGAVVLMRLGYNVNRLAQLLWLYRAQCFYWGDIDTHGFAILNRVRTYLRHIRSILMDEKTLLSHRALWGREPIQAAVETLPLLTHDEQFVYKSLKQHRWQQNLRMEQERIDWDYAMHTISVIHD